MTETRVYLRSVTKRDRDDFVAAMRMSMALHEPWISSPSNREMFNSYLKRVERDDHAGFLVIDQASEAIAGCININNIVRGSFLSATLGYYVTAPFAGRGYMHEGLKLLVEHAFRNMGLHRLEANIQPENQRSIDLVKRCGFHWEGLSPQYLFIAGTWRDHERWTRLDDRPSLHASS